MIGLRIVARLYSEEVGCIAESTSHFITCNNSVLSGWAIHNPGQDDSRSIPDPVTTDLQTENFGKMM